MPKFTFGTKPLTGKPTFQPRVSTPMPLVTKSGSMDVGARFIPKVAPQPRTAPTLYNPAILPTFNKQGTVVKGTIYDLQNPVLEALNAGIIEGLGRVKTSIAGVGKMVAESKPTIKGVAIPAQPELAKKFDAVVASTESWIQKYQPESMTTFQRLVKDLSSGAISIFSSIGIGVLTGGAGASAALFGLMQAGDKYVEQRKAGVSPERAGGIASSQGFVEAALEGIGLETFLKLSRGTVWNTLIRAGTEAVQEASQTFGENVLDTVWDKNQNLSEGVLRSALIGGLLGLPAAVSVSAYEQSSPRTQAIREVQSTLHVSEKTAVRVVDTIAKAAITKVSPLVDETLREAQKSITLPDMEATLGIQKKAPLRTTSGMGALVGQPQTVAGGVKPTPKFHLALPSTATPQISPAVAISPQEVSVPTPPVVTPPQIAPTQEELGKSIISGNGQITNDTVAAVLGDKTSLDWEQDGYALRIAYLGGERYAISKIPPVSTLPQAVQETTATPIDHNWHAFWHATDGIYSVTVTDVVTIHGHEMAHIKEDGRLVPLSQISASVQKGQATTPLPTTATPSPVAESAPTVSKMEIPPSTEQPSVVPAGKPLTTLEKFSAKQAEVDAKIAPLLGKKVKDGGITYQLVGANDQYVPYFSKVTNGKVGKKQITLQNYGRSELLRDLGEAAPETKLGRRVVILNKEGGKLKGNMVEIAGLEKYKFAVIEGKAFEHDSKGQAIRDYRGNTASHTNYRLHELSLPSSMGYTYDTAQEAIDHAYDMLIGAKEKNETPLETFDRLYADVLKRHEKSVASDGETTPALANPQYAPTVTTGTSVTNTAPLPAGQTTSGQEVTPSYVSNEPNLSTSGTSQTIPADNEAISRMTVAFDQIEQHLGEKKSEVKAVEGTFQQAFATFLKQSGIPKGALAWNQALDWYKASRGEKSFAKRVEMVKRAIEKYNLGIEQKQRASIIGEISSLQAKSKSGVYAIAQEELDSLLGKYRKSRLSKKHKASLEASRAYFAEHPDLDLPSNLADEISLLDKETLKGMSVKELTALREKVKGILSSGKEAYREWKKRNELKQTLYKKSVLARAKSLGGATSENIGTVMTRWQKLYQDALAIDKTLEPTDVWMNQLGLMNEKKRFDDKYNHFLFVTRTIKSRVADLMAKNHLTMEDRQKIKLFQIVRMGREDLIAPIAEHLKMTVEQAGSITLTEGQKEVLDYMDSQYKTFFPIVQDYLARVKNQTIHQEDSYAPLLADPNALGNDTIESNAVTFYHNTKTISADSVRAREQLHYLTTSDAVSDFERYVTDMQYMIEMGELTKRLSEVVNSKEFQAKAGVLGQSILSDWLDTMARRGGASGEQRIRILDLLRKNTNTGYMTAKLGTVFVQFTAIADGFNEIGVKWMVAGAERQISPEWRSLMKDFAAEVYGNEADPDFTEPTWWKGLVKGLRTPVVAADAVVRRTVFLGAYARACERLGLAGTVEEFSSSDKEVKQTIREALAEAMQVTRKAQGTSEFKDQPLSISRGRIGNLIKNRSVGKLMTQFQSFNFFRFSNIKDTIWTSGIKRGRLDKALGGIFWLLLVASMSEVLLRRGARWISSGGKTAGEATDKITVGLKSLIEDTFSADSSWLTQLTAETFSGLVDNIPFMGQLVGMMMYGKDPLPVADAIIKFSQGVGSIVNGATGTTKLRGVAGVISAGGSLAGVPGSAQVGGTLRDVIVAKKKPKFKFTLPY